jgi:hypothetical protein
MFNFDVKQLSFFLYQYPPRSLIGVVMMCAIVLWILSEKANVACGKEVWRLRQKKRRKLGFRGNVQ